MKTFKENIGEKIASAVNEEVDKLKEGMIAIQEMAGSQETSKRIESFALSEKGEHILINTLSGALQITDLMISNKSEDDFELWMGDEDGNRVSLLNSSICTLVHSYPTGLLFWKGARLMLTLPKGIKEGNFTISVGYNKWVTGQDISVWRTV